MKKVILFFILLIGSFFSIAAYADDLSVIDEANLFAEEEISQLNQAATDLNNEIKGQIFILTVTQIDKDPETFSDDFLRNQVGNDNNGAVLMINMGARDYYLSTSGNMIDYLDDDRIDNILESVQKQLSNGNYYDAAQTFLSKSSAYVSEGVAKGHYRVDSKTGKITYYKVLTPFEIILSLLLAGVLTLIPFFVIKSSYQLKKSNYTYSYEENATVQLTQKKDHLVNSFVRTRRIPKNPPPSSGGKSGGGGSTTHSSGGGTFGGRGGKF